MEQYLLWLVSELMLVQGDQLAVKGLVEGWVKIFSLSPPKHLEQPHPTIACSTTCFDVGVWCDGEKNRIGLLCKDLNIRTCPESHWSCVTCFFWTWSLCFILLFCHRFGPRTKLFNILCYQFLHLIYWQRSWEYFFDKIVITKTCCSELALF